MCANLVMLGFTTSADECSQDCFGYYYEVLEVLLTAEEIEEQQFKVIGGVWQISSIKMVVKFRVLNVQIFGIIKL
ncbi:hypothetical protein FHY67_12475 [Acinetobacter radioresistens]|jgi:hypothetical protein|uniref:Uncharacterized protein n=2 Tax=Moraxellaceae TaxID=468 RepID=A0A8H2JXY0_ACIRA|nr:hypothetical protein [Acinetobacter radioresistens]MCU4309952.1 hypothetical protein [Acinetobacter radioresistens]MCU4518023.1 hypothetical protein [Acinetobacter radioresistens]MCU4565811.1 hypothetical protein [Acinetobacter radioresistens]MCU4596268.1 hypothetical protein [Acinetobacter radioresistens]PKD80822.1 hypothetical protein CW313_12630 [Acinetobacter radioresistens]